MNELADNTDLKAAFALNLLLLHGDAVEASRATVTDNVGFAQFIAQNWQRDLYVLQVKNELLTAHGEAFFLPSRYDTAHKIMQVAERALQSDDKLKALKLYADVMGYIERPGVQINNSVTATTNKVMVLLNHGTDAEWEAAAISSQATLVADAQP